MDKIKILIVEDETNIAEIHGHFLRQLPRFEPVGIASTMQMARTMIKVHQPHIILLDNYLPDGQGVELLQDIAGYKLAHKIDVILITAADEIETVKKAMQFGCFDYLLKPVSYDRLTETLNRYLKRHSVLTAFDHLDQRRIDELFNLQSRDSPNQQLPKGIEQVTLDKVKQVFTHQPTQAFTADSLGQMIGISKTTARRYLEYCCASGLIRAENEYGKVGRPERIYLKA